jgi:dynein regulatory complex protein 1
LLEQKLVSLLEPLEKNEQSMVKLDSIFKSLGIETENDVRLLAQYFINFRQYKELVKNEAYTQKLPGGGDLNLFGGSKDSEREGENEEESGHHHRENIVPVEAVELITANEAISTLKLFLSQNHKNEKRQKLAKFRLTNLDDRNDSADVEYWKCYEHMIDEKKDKLWDAMLYSLQKYQ